MFRSSVILIALLFMFSGCSTTAVQYFVKRPAPVNLKGHKKIAIGNFRGHDRSHANMVAGELAEELLESGHFDKVMDRKHLNDVIGEQKLQLAGIIDNNDISRIGKVSGASVFIYGNVDVDNYQEQRSSREVVTTNVQKETVEKHGVPKTIETVTYQTNRENSRKGQYNFAVTYQIVDVETSELILVKRFSAVKSDVKTLINGSPDMINEDAMCVACVEEVTSQFVRQLTPYYDIVRAEFQLDNDLPEVDNAVKRVRAEQYDDAVKIFTDSTNKNDLKPKVKAKSYYNLGIMFFILKRYNDAEKLVDKALNLNPDEDLYERALRMIRYESANDQRLKDQE